MPLWSEMKGNGMSNGPAIADIADPHAPTTTNDRGGSQSLIPVRFDLIDAKAMFEMAKVLHHGAEKYGEDNWRLISIEEHINHGLMHSFAYLAGDRTDDHLSHWLCRATFAVGVSLQETHTYSDGTKVIVRPNEAR